MKKYFILAWRNIWRNKRRALITIASVFFAVFFALLMRSLQLGSYANMEKNIVEFYNGYIQVMDSSYWENKTINHTLYYADSVEEILLSLENVQGLIPRLESFALASAGDLTKGVMLIGTNPVKEDGLTNISDRIVKGEFLAANDKGVLVGEKLASYLKLDVLDTIVLLGQGFHGVSAADKFPIRGILHFSNPELNGRALYMSLSQAQYFYTAENRISSIVLDIKDREKLDKTLINVKSALSDRYEVMSWREMLTELVQQIESDNASGLIMLAILYMIIAFGILGTVIMMTAERRREMGVMVAVGMQRWRLAIITGLETLMLGVIGIIAGAIVSIPILSYFTHHPIPASGEMKKMFEEYGIEALWVFSNEPSMYLHQAEAVIILTLLAMLYPIISILRMDAIKAIRS